MMRRILGAPWAGRRAAASTAGIRGAFLNHATKLPGGAGVVPLMVVVALGEPGVPVISWARPGKVTNITAAAAKNEKPL